MSIAGVVLAAGFSRRLGRSKQMLVLDGRTLLERAAQTAKDAGLAPVLLVVRENTLPKNFDLGSWCTIVRNEEAQEGLASSIRAGVAATLPLSVVDGVVLLTCDQVLLTPNHLEQLVVEPGRITASAYGGKQGVPAYFPRGSFQELLQLRGDAGARDLFIGVRAVRNEELLLDIDTEEDVKRAELYLAAHNGE